MVQKVSKRGVYSGNTLRASNSRFNRQYSRRSCLCRRSMMNTTMKDTILDDMKMNQDDIVYSLNKKGRWEVPSILKDSILSGSYKNFKYNVKLLVSHNIAKKSRTIGFYSSKGKMKKIESKKKTYINGDSVATKAKVDNENGSMGLNQEVVQIEVVYPSPKTSSMVHNPKYIGHTIDKPENGRGRTSKSRRQRQKMNVGKYYEELNDSYGDVLDDFDDEDDELDEESSLYLYNSSVEETSTTTELLEDILIHAAMMNSLCESRQNNKKHARNSGKKYETKDNKIYELSSEIDETEEDFSTVNESIENGILSQRKMDPVYIILPKEELNHNLLKERYGLKFQECPSFPRKFVIDVSDRMKQRMLTTKCWKQEYIGRWDLTSCVIFTYDAYDVNNTGTHNVYRVCLNMATNAENFRILTMFDYFEAGVEEVLERAVAFVDMVSTDGFIEREINPPKGKKTSTEFENLNRHQKIEKEATFVTRRSLYTDIFSNDQNSNENMAHQLEFECICSEFCGICFDQLSDGGKHGTALTGCGHWFCDECWVIHCRSRMATGALKVTCPQFDCKETVDDTTLLTLVNVFEVLNLKRRAIETMFQSSENTLWCPNPICGRVIKVDNPTKANDVACVCGAQICFQCQQKSHWPVSCDMASHYWGKLKRLGDDNFLFDSTTRIVVRGKQCPKCKRFVEKLAGCFYMNCPCGAAFCWGCLGLYPNHRNTDKCNQYKNGDLKGTDTLVVREKEAFANVLNQTRSGHYKKALEHRDARHPMEITKLKTGIRKISFKCKNAAKRKGPYYFAMLEHHDEHTDDVDEKINTLLTSMLSVYIELHHIAEYSYILLEELSKTGRKYSQYRGIVNCMGYYAEKISTLLTDTDGIKDFRPVITALINIKQKSVDITKTAVKIIEKIDLPMPET